MGQPARGSASLATAAALVCFAANSLICRLALAGGHIDAAGFTTVRLASGAAMLVLLARARLRGKGSWVSAGALFSYAAPFSFAYLRLDAGTGALILFVAVQLTMIGWGIVRGERPRPSAWLGVAIALGGLVGLAAPGATAPDPLAGALMTASGIAWGIYSLRGRAARADPLPATAANFALSVPLTLPLLAGGALTGGLQLGGRGLLLAAASGAVASGLGYVSWYAALRALSATRAAVLQLLVPILAALGGVALLDEQVTLRLVLSGAAILVGVGLTIHARA